MTQNHVIVESGASRSVAARDQVHTLAVIDLGDDLAVTCFNPGAQKVGLARNIAPAQLPAFIESVMGAMAGPKPPTAHIRLIGGGTGKITKLTSDMLDQLDIIDDGRNILKIVSADIGQKPYPASFSISAADGKIVKL